MIARLLLSTLVVLSAGTAAYTFSAAETETSTLPAVHVEKIKSAAPEAEPSRPLSRLEKWQADQQAERDAALGQAEMPSEPSANHAGFHVRNQTQASGVAKQNVHSVALRSVTLSEGVTVSRSDRDHVTDAIARMAVKPLHGVDFSVAVGSRVPRDLRLYWLPAEVGEIVPQYRQHRFMVVDKDILIVEPSSQKIVAVIPRDAAVTTMATAAAVTEPASSTSPVTPAASTATPAGAPAVTAVANTPAAGASKESAEPEVAKTKKHAGMSRTQRKSARRTMRESRHAEVRVGQTIPDSVALHDLPPSYRGDRTSTARTIVGID